MRLIPSSRGGMLLRFFLAAFMVIGFAAATTAVAGLLQVRQITQYIDATPAFKASPSVTVPDQDTPRRSCWSAPITALERRSGTSTPTR